MNLRVAQTENKFISQQETENQIQQSTFLKIVWTYAESLW